MHNEAFSRVLIINELVLGGLNLLYLKQERFAFRGQTGRACGSGGIINLSEPRTRRDNSSSVETTHALR